MSWHYSQALVEDFSAATCSDGERFAPLKSMTTHAAYCWRDRTMESLDLFQYGMTFDPLTADLGGELLTWCLAVFRAPTSALPEPCGDVRESMAPLQDCGASTCESSTSASRCTSSEKTAPNCAGKGSTESFENWPAAGTFAGGQLSPLQTLDFGTSANDSGFLLPTPTTRDWKDTPGMATERLDGRTRTDRLPMLVFHCARSAGIDLRCLTPTDARTVSVKGLTMTLEGTEFCPELSEWLMGWPIGWTDCEPLETGRFLQWQRTLGAYCEPANVRGEA